MGISTNTPVKELLEMWVKYSHQIWKNISVTDKTIRALNEVRSTLDKHGIPSILIMSMDEESYTLEYMYRGSRIEKKVQILA